jgi:hypothetical protein
MKSINEWQTREVTIFNHVEVMGIALDAIEVIFSKNIWSFSIFTFVLRKDALLFSQNRY